MWRVDWLPVNSSQRRQTVRSTRHTIFRYDELTVWRVDWFPIINSCTFSVGLSWAVKKSTTRALVCNIKVQLRSYGCTRWDSASDVDSLSVIISNGWSRRRPKQVCKGSSCVLGLHQSTLARHDKGYIATKFCWSRTPISKTLPAQRSLSSCNRFGDYAITGE